MSSSGLNTKLIINKMRNLFKTDNKDTAKETVTKKTWQ